MVRQSTCPSFFYKQLAAYIVICSIMDITACSHVFLSETFEACGIFLSDFQSTSHEQGDVIHEIIEHLQLSQKTSRSLMIKNELAKKDIHPGIFRSMKYECFLYVHINFGKDLFSTIPRFEDPLQSALYQKALFLIVVNNNPHGMINGESWYLHDERQYRLFVNRVNMNLGYNPFREKPFDFYERYFFCTFCDGGLVQLNPRYKRFLSLKLSSFEKIEESFNAVHYYQVRYESILENEKFCRQTNIIYLYRRKLECHSQVILVNMILSASGINITTKPYLANSYDFKKMPQIFPDSQYYEFEEPFEYSSPVFKEYEYPSIIYCLNLGRVTVAETNMWTKYVPMDIWGLVGLCLLLLAILNANF